MKVALCVDFLLSRNQYIDTIKSFIELYPDCELFALAHIPGQIDEFIEQRKITSSFLSKFIRNEEDILKYVYLFQAAAQSLFIPCGFDKIIYITSGFALNMKYCSKSETFLYQYNDPFELTYTEAKGFLNKFFRSYIFNRVENSLIKFNGTKLETIFTPPFFIANFPVFTEKILNNFEKKYLTIYVSGIGKQELEECMKFAGRQTELKTIIIGNNHLLNGFDTNEFTQFSELDKDQHSTVLASSKYIIDFSRNYWPKLAITAAKMKLSSIILENWKDHNKFNINKSFFNFIRLSDLNNTSYNHESYNTKLIDCVSIKTLENMPFKRKVKKMLNF